MSNFKPAAPTGTPASTPTGLTATPSGSNTINLTWNASTGGPEWYRIYRAPTANFANAIHFNIGNVTSYSDTTVAPATTEYYRIQSMKAGVGSILSAGVSATTTAASAPTHEQNVAARIWAYDLVGGSGGTAANRYIGQPGGSLGSGSWIADFFSVRWPLYSRWFPANYAAWFVWMPYGSDPTTKAINMTGRRDCENTVPPINKVTVNTTQYFSQLIAGTLEKNGVNLTDGKTLREVIAYLGCVTDPDGTNPEFATDSDAAVALAAYGAGQFTAVGAKCAIAIDSSSRLTAAGNPKMLDFVSSLSHPVIETLPGSNVGQIKTAMLAHGNTLRTTCSLGNLTKVRRAYCGLDLPTTSQYYNKARPAELLTKFAAYSEIIVQLPGTGTLQAQRDLLVSLLNMTVGEFLYAGTVPVIAGDNTDLSTPLNLKCAVPIKAMASDLSGNYTLAAIAALVN